MQEFIIKDATTTNKLKRNKSIENLKQGNKEATTGGKGKRSKGNSAPKPPKRHTRSSRRLLWEDLLAIAQTKAPWIVEGDLNTILQTHENQGGSINNLGPIEDFKEMILDMGLIDAGFEGEPYT
ncbi:UNVERIFIED_CONTAM: hypothetical protein Scaly_2023700 [Sesamum calycinum]|uniref:Uncharacterized protein n=1 Tax=Sesamum calycinum TaxID=2727403 RepID=A0AAW2N1Y8_9LAMI